MAYSTLTDLYVLVIQGKVTELCKDQTPDIIISGAGGIIEEADATIDLYNTTEWSAEAKKACSRAIAAKILFTRHGTGKMPRAVAEQAQLWEDRLAIVGLRAASSWTRVAFDPAYDETDDELDALLERDPLG